MADLSAVTDNYFTIASETYSDNLSASISAGATTVPVNSASTYTTGDCVVLTVDPGTANEATFIGKKDTGNQFIECVWTEGNTGIGHDTGATITDYDSATHHNAQTKGIKQFANDDGTLITSAVRAALNLVDESTAGWEVGTLPAPDTITYNGNRSYDLVFNATDHTDTLSPGMRVRTTRTVSAPTQCADLEADNSEYFSSASPSGITFTDDFTCMAWVKRESNSGASQSILSRFNGTSGFLFNIQQSGKVTLAGYNGGSGNFGTLSSYQSIPYDRWVHVAVTLDMSGSTGTMYFDGVRIAASYSSGGTNPTSLVQAGNLQIGAFNGGTSYMDGKVAQVGLFDTALSEATIREYSTHGLSGSETNCVGAWSLDNDLTDLNSNGNDMTANGGALATDTDSPFGNNAVSDTLDYGIITNIDFSTNTTVTVQVPEGCTIPTSGGVTAFDYSLVDTPYGFPKNKGKWNITLLYGSFDDDAIATSITVFKGPIYTEVPIGAWTIKMRGVHWARTSGTTSSWSSQLGFSTSTTAYTDPELVSTIESAYAGSSAVRYENTDVACESQVVLSTQTTYRLVNSAGSATISEQHFGNSSGASPAVVTAECAYL